jgi:hypothetical protein
MALIRADGAKARVQMLPKICFVAITIVAFITPVSHIPAQNRVPSGSETRKPRQAKPDGTSKPTEPDRQGTRESPVFVKEIPTPKTPDESTQEARDRAEKSANDKKLVEFTGWLVVATLILAAVGLFQLFVFGWQARYLRETVQAAGEQSKAMERTIEEAGRSASAMEKVAIHIETSAQAATDSVAALKERTAQQMRAYLTVNIGGAIYQERPRNLKFEAKPLLINTGHTPAHKVSYIAKAAILPVPLPEDFSFPLSEDFIGASVLGPQQSATLSGVVDELCDDSEVETIKSVTGKALYTWGVIRYEDIFKEHRLTKFCMIYTWQSDGKVFGYFIPRHNEAT